MTQSFNPERNLKSLIVGSSLIFRKVDGDWVFAEVRNQGDPPLAKAPLQARGVADGDNEISTYVITRRDAINIPLAEVSSWSATIRDSLADINMVLQSKYIFISPGFTVDDLIAELIRRHIDPDA